MTNITQEQIDNFRKILYEIHITKCKLCGYESINEVNFHEGICLMCCKIHEIDY